MSIEPIHGAEELRNLALLREVQELLAEGLNSLGGKPTISVDATYLGWTAVSVNRAAEGYLCLRDSGRVAASKLLVRPAIEATFSGLAAIKRKDFLFRKAYSEWDEDRKLFAKDAVKVGEAKKALEDLKHAFQSKCPSVDLACKQITVRDTAEMAELLAIYEGTYRLYCQFTHGALRAALGDLDKISDTIDTPVVTWCVLQMLDHLQTETLAQLPDLIPFRRRLLDANLEMVKA